MDQNAHITLNRRCDNDLASLLPLLGQVEQAAGAGSVRKIAIEACEGSADLGEALAKIGEQTGWAVELAHPLYVSKLKGSPDKSDYSDAKLLADLSRVGYLPRVWLAPKDIRELRQLIGHRHRLAADRRALKLRINAVLRNQRINVDGSRWTKPWCLIVKHHPDLSQANQWLIEELFDELDAVVRRLSRTEARLKKVTADDATVAKLKGFAGVGDVTAWTLRASIGRFDRFKNAKQLCRYCGLSPRNTASGERQTQGKLINAADKQLRAILIQAAHRLIRTEPRWKALAGKLIAQGKPKNVAVAAVANRWMRTVHHRMTVNAAQEAPAEQAA